METEVSSERLGALFSFQEEKVWKDELEQVRPGCRQLHFGGCASAILDVLRAGVLIVNREGQVVLANAAATLLLHRGMDEILQTPIGQLLAPFEELCVGLEMPSGRAEFAQVLPDGTEVCFGVSVSICDRLKHKEERWHLALLFQDITRWKKLREQNDRLLRMSTVSELLPTMLHELKNPLASIATSVQFLTEELAQEELSDTALREVLTEDLQAIWSEVKRMELTLQGIGMAGRELRLGSPVPIQQALEQAMRILARQAHHRGLEVCEEIEVLPELPLAPAVLRAVMFNLVTNAIQACSTGDTITFRASFKENIFTMTVADTGSGMTEETLTQCRELFFSTKPRGSGIGLALCHKVSREAGGALTIESARGEGTSVHFSIPCLAPSFHS